MELTHRLPPLLWVRVFEAAARHENFVAAAKELSVTPGAVSRVVKELESFMGVTLFVRGSRGVELTNVARAYASDVAPAIRQIAAASARVHSNTQPDVLRVSAMPALAQRWLVPRLGKFNELHPDITVLIDAQPAVLDPAQSSFDVALRYDDRQDAGELRVDLFTEDLFPVVSPELARKAELRDPKDLLELTALYDTYWESDWDVWLAARAMQVPKRRRALYFTLYAMAVDAAVAGQGVLIGHAGLIQDELASGKLIAPFGPRIRSSKRYYALAHPASAPCSATRAFLAWLAAQASSITEHSPCT